MRRGIRAEEARGHGGSKQHLQLTTAWQGRKEELTVYSRSDGGFAELDIAGG